MTKETKYHQAGQPASSDQNALAARNDAATTHTQLAAMPSSSMSLTPTKPLFPGRMSDDRFTLWAMRREMPAAGIEFVQRIRKNGMPRPVGGRFSVRGIFASAKMRQSRSFESHRCELAAITEQEYDPTVLEYYTQVGTLDLKYTAAGGRPTGCAHTPDILVIGEDFAGFLECKVLDDLKVLAKEMPGRYMRGDNGEWRCPPAEEAAARLGLGYRIYVASGRTSDLIRNLNFLGDYWRSACPLPPAKITDAVLARVRESQGVTYAAVRAEVPGATADHLNILICSGAVYTDLRNCLLTEPEGVKLFSDRVTAEAINVIGQSKGPALRMTGGAVELTPTAKINYRNAEHTVTANDGTIVQLLSSDGKCVTVKTSDLEQMVYEGNVTAAAPANLQQARVLAKLNSASEADQKIAVERWKAIEPFINGGRGAKRIRRSRHRSIRRWIRKFRDAKDNLGNGFLGLLPDSRPGRPGSHLEDEVEALIRQVIAERAETRTAPKLATSHRQVVLRCQQGGLPTPSLNTFLQRVRERPLYNHIMKTKGPRAAYQKKKFYPYLDLTVPVHGDRAWEIAHIDHTEVDLELVCSQTGQPLGRPWLTILTDARTRRILAFSLSFFSERSASCMLVLRECVRRHNRLPGTLVVDNGKAFDSTYFETLIAYYGVHKKSRPPAHARFGSVCERLFGTANTLFFHNLVGNTKITKNVRQVTKSVDPKGLAVWTLEALTDALKQFFYDIYDQRAHPALGQSPRQAADRLLEQMGRREHTLIPYDQIFHIVTLPKPKNGTAKVHGQKGIHLNYIDYWTDAFLDPKIEGTEVQVRYDPWNASIAYALVSGHWVECISSYVNVFRNWSRQAIELGSKQLLAQRKQHGQSLSISTHELAAFMEEIAKTEEILLLQRQEKAANYAAIPIHAQEVVAPKLDAAASGKKAAGKSTGVKSKQATSFFDGADKIAACKFSE